MAKKEDTKKPVLERTYNVPLRKQYMRAPNWNRTPRAVRALKAFIVKHMKSDNVIIGVHANRLLWKNGVKNPPHHIKVTAIKDAEGRVVAELVGAKDKAEGPQKKKAAKLKEKEAKKPKAEKKEETKIEQLTEAVEEKKEEKAEAAKEIQKEEITELKKQHPKVHAPKQAAVPKPVDVRPSAPKSY